LETLLLDAAYLPRERIDWRRAIIKVIIDKKAEIIEEYPDRFIRTVNWSIKVPSVIRLLKPVKKSRAVKFSRHAIYARDNGRCQYCGTKVPKHEYQNEHVIPRAQGGKTCWENIVVSCQICNSDKANRTPEQAGMRLITKPVRPKKMPDTGGNFGMMYRPGMPESWKNYLRDHAYWNVELEHDDDK
jgi:5-methylcytosine-specific restriction endonuclease McrA